MNYFLSLFFILFLQNAIIAMKASGLTLDEYCALQKKYMIEDGYNESSNTQICLYDTLSDKELYEIFTSVNHEKIAIIHRKSDIHLNVMIPSHHFDPFIFGKFINLTTLFLKRYNITDISFISDALCNLREVWLDDNSIKNIEPLALLPKITILSLCGNDITVTKSLKKIVGQLKYLDISGNPLVFQETEELQEHYENVKCPSEKIISHIHDVLLKIAERDYYLISIQKKNLKKKMKRLKTRMKKFPEREREELIIKSWDEYN